MALVYRGGPGALDSDWLFSSLIISYAFGPCLVSGMSAFWTMPDDKRLCNIIKQKKQTVEVQEQ